MESSQPTLEVDIQAQGEDIYHRVKNLPQLAELNAKVKKIVSESSYWERYGKGLVNIGVSIPLHVAGLFLCSYDQPIVFLVGFFLCAMCYSALVNRASHLAAHNSLFETPWLNTVARYVLVESNGFFSVKAAMQIHIKEHHPYTNIIGLGDSSSWKAPFLPRYTYMFFAPLFLPLMTPFVSVKELIIRKDLKAIPPYLLSIMFGLYYNVYFIMAITGIDTVPRALVFMFAYRGVTGLPYIHINIFQHIGLPMYELKARPSKIYQMSTGVLNLDRNIVNDFIMGHTLVNCHVEHHLFPNLSDEMVLKIKPVVRQFLLDNGLPYHEKSYMNRLSHFVSDYDRLMVKAPPITHFVGLQ